MPVREETPSQGPTRSKPSDSTVCWYVMRAVACGCHKSIRATLEEAGVEFFQPLHTVVRRKAGRVVKSLEPLISNIFFVRGSKADLLPYTTSRCNHFQFYYDHCSGKQADCLRVPDKQMSDFMRVYRETLSDPQVFTLGELQLRPGARVRILGGPFHGIEGTFQRVKGHRNRQLVVTLEGLLAITAAISPELVEIIKPDTP